MEMIWNRLLKRKGHLHIILKSIFVFVVWYFGNYRETGSVSAYFYLLAAWSVSICGISLDLHIWIWNVHLFLWYVAFILYFSLLKFILIGLWFFTVLCRLNILIGLLIVIFLSILLSVIDCNLASRLAPVSYISLIIFFMIPFSNLIYIIILRSLNLLIQGKISLIVLYFNLKIRTWIIFLKLILGSVLWSETLICVFIWWLMNIYSIIVDSWN